MLDHPHHPHHHPSLPPPLPHHNQLQKYNDIEFAEALEKNRIVSGSALARAVQDASIGQYLSALDTLQTAISLIKQSKIAQDERCKLLISTLQDTKKGIEDRCYSGGGNMPMVNNNNTTNNNSGNLNLSNRNDSSTRAESRDRER